MPTTNSKAAPKAWTFLLYMAGDNSLDINSLNDLDEIKTIGSGPHLDIVAQLDRAETQGSRRYHLRSGTTADEDVVATLPEQNTGDPTGLIDFIRWGIREYPAHRYALILWNHGKGWDDTDIYAGERGSGPRFKPSGRLRFSLFRKIVVDACRRGAEGTMESKAILFDDQAKDFLDNSEMKQVLLETKTLLGRKLDLLGMDACLMSMAEVGYQLRDSVDIMVGSEQTEPEDGWPYGRLLMHLSETSSDPTPEELAKAIVSTYIASYRDGSEVTQSAARLASSERLGAAVQALAKALTEVLRDRPSRLELMDVRNHVQNYQLADNVDLVDLCTRLCAAPLGPAVTAAAKMVIDAVTGAGGWVVASAYRGQSVAGSHGVAIYFPTGSISPLYSSLDFATATGWGAFLTRYLQAMRG